MIKTKNFVFLFCFLLSILSISCSSTVSRKSNTMDLFSRLEKSANLVADIFQVARLQAQTINEEKSGFSSFIEICSVEDLKILKIYQAPTNEKPTVFGFNFRFIPDLKAQADTSLDNLVIAPLIAWPLIVDQHKDAEFPVILASPLDGYRFGAKPLRIRWLTYISIEKILSGNLEELEVSKWLWFKRKEAYEKIMHLGLNKL